MTPGDRVLYCLDTHDAQQINTRRDNFQNHQAHTSGHKHPHSGDGWSGAPGYQAHVGLTVHAGQWLAADVAFGNPGFGGLPCLRVLLPGSDLHVVYNVPEGDAPGCWKVRPS